MQTADRRKTHIKEFEDVKKELGEMKLQVSILQQKTDSIDQTLKTLTDFLAGLQALDGFLSFMNRFISSLLKLGAIFGMIFIFIYHLPDHINTGWDGIKNFFKK